MTDRWLVRENAVLPGSDSSGWLGTSIYNHGPSVPSKVNQEVMDSPSVRTYNGGYKGGKTVFNKNQSVVSQAPGAERVDPTLK